MGKTKGITALNYVTYIKERATAAQLDAIKAQMDQAARQLLFDAPILAMTFVDYGAVMQLLIAADRVLGTGDLRLLREASSHNQRQNFNGIYKALLPLFSPEFLVERASKLWERYHDTGRLVSERTGPNRLRLTLYNYPDIPQYHGPEIEGAFVALLEMAHARLGSMTHCQCVHQNQPACSWEITWS